MYSLLSVNAVDNKGSEIAYVYRANYNITHAQYYFICLISESGCGHQKSIVEGKLYIWYHLVCFKNTSRFYIAEPIMTESNF